MVTDMYNFSFSIIEVLFDFATTENNIFLRSRLILCVLLKWLSVCVLKHWSSITVPISVKVTIVFDAFKRNKNLRYLIWFGCFLHIHMINRSWRGRAARMRTFSSRADGISQSFAALTPERYLQQLTELNAVSQRGHVMFSLKTTQIK